MENQQIDCPKCGCQQISANQKGFSGGKALAGAVLTGGLGLLAGTIGSKKVIITCLGCGFRFKAGEYKNLKGKFDRKRAINQFIVKIFKKLFKKN
jgi:predicted nucleic-acid-binding Zn-ribbon protein